MNKKDIHQNLLRLAVTLAVAVLTTAAAVAQDVPLKTATLKAGTGSGSDITITSHDAGRYYGNDINGYNVPNGQFYTDGDDLWLKMPDCPDSFTPPVGMAFAGWNLNGSSTFHFFPGGKFNMTMDVVLWAKWEEANPSITTTDMNGIGYWAYLPANARRGDCIVFKIIFNEGQYEAGYRLQSVTVTGTDGRSFEITTNRIGEEFLNNVYATNSSYVYVLEFTMPATSVTLTANWIAPVDHSIILTNDGHGTATASPTSGVVNTKVTLTAEPDEGYLFKEWQVLAGGVKIDNTNEFLIGMEDVAVKAIFRPIVQAVIHFDAGEGTVTPASMTTGINGKLASLPTPTREGWKFEGWFTATAGGTKVTTETLIEEETTLYARWYQGSHYTLVMPDIVELIPGTERTPVTFEATELELAQDANGYTPSWLRMNFSQGTLVNQTDNSKTIAFKVERETGPYPTRQINLDMTSTGTNTFYIYVSSDDWESAALGTYTGTLPCMVGYFYSVDNISFEQIETRNIPVTVTIQASGYDVSVAASPEGGGTVTGGGTYDVDDLVIVTATPESGYKFVNWTENGEEVSTSATYSFLATANRSIVANFERVYTITVSADPTEGGTVTGGTSGTYTLGTQMEFKATPNEGYRFKNWTENGEEVSTSATYSFLATANRSIVANFERVHTITVSTDPADGGTVTGGTSGTYALGTQFEFKETPNEGYRFVNWTIDGINGGSETTYPFTVNGDFSTVVAHFERIYPLSGDYVGFYDKNSNPITTAAEGETVTVSYNPYDPEDDDKVIIPSGKYFTGRYTATEGVTVTMKEAGDGAFIMPAKAVTVSAVLADQEEYTLDLTTTNAQAISETIWLLLYSLEKNTVYDENNYRNLDLNLDGTPDVLLTEDIDNDTQLLTYYATRLPGANAITSNCRFAVSYLIPQQYNSVLFMLNTPKTIQSDWITIGDGTPIVYNGETQEPAVTVKYGATLLSAETDYDVTYSNNKNACEATAENAPTVTVSVKDGNGTYAGSASVTFAIARKPVTVTGGITAKAVIENGNTTAAIDCSKATITGAVGDDALTIDGVTGTIDAGDANTVTLNYTNASLTIGDAVATNYVIAAEGNQAKATISSTVVKEEKRNEDGTKTITTVEKKVEEDESVTEIIVELTENENGEVIGKKESEKNTKENADHSTVIKETTVVKDGDNNVIKTIEKEITIDPNGNKRETTVEKDVSGTTVNTYTATNNMALSDEAPKIQGAGVDDLRRLADNGTGVLAAVSNAALAVSQKDADKMKTVQSLQVVQDNNGPVEPEKRTEHLRITEITEPFNVYFERSQRYARLTIGYTGGRVSGISSMIQRLIDDATNRRKAHARSTQADDEEIIIESGVQYEILTDEPFAITFMANEGDIDIESIKIENPIDIDGNGVVNAVDLVKAIAAGKTQAGIDEIVNAIMQK